MSHTLQKLVSGYCLTLLLATSLFAQERTHEGFFFSVGLGAAGGTVNGYNNQNQVLILKGTGVELDFQMGGSVSERLLAHGTLTLKTVVAPEINGSKSNSSGFAISETMIGGGITRYTQRNLFFSGNLGAGRYSFIDTSTSTPSEYVTKYGFSCLLKAGKEWWISKNLGLGFAITYGKTKLNNDSGSYTEKWNSNRYGFLLHLTFD